jgi:hypothetical protein
MMFLYIPILAVSESIWTTMHLEILFWEFVLVYTLKNELVRYTVRCMYEQRPKKAASVPCDGSL